MVQHQSLTERLPEPVVVLGGGGFIGSNLVQRLVQMGYDTYAVDVQFHDWRFRLDESHTLTCDLRDHESALNAVRGAGTVFHLAADMGGVEYFHSDKDFAASIDNQLITTNVVKQCVVSGVQRLIYTSSVCGGDIANQYDEGHPWPISERDLFFGLPDARYGADKRNGAYVVANAPLDGRVAVLNTVYGPGQEHAGQRMKFPAAVATKAIKSLETGVLPLFGNGQQIRPYLYIDDALDRLIALGEADEALVTYPYHGDYGIRYFCIGANTTVTCKEVAETCLRIVGSDAEIVYDLGKPSGVLARNTDIRKWEALFGTTTETSIEDGFTKFIEWLIARV